LSAADTSLPEILKRAKAGNQIAFSSLLDTFWNDVYGFLLIRTKNENDAEDITIQTFSKAFDKIHTFDESYEFKTWLNTIAKNLHIDLVRTIRRRSTHHRTKFGEPVTAYKTAKTTLPKSDQPQVL